MIAGPNGAGKSTLLRRFNRGRMDVVNPDDIAKALDPERINDRAIQLQAGRLALAERQRRLTDGKNFAVETTLSGHSELGLMRQAGEYGYKVNLVFVALARAELSSNRVALRVQHGGHDVPVEDVQRRFGRIYANLPEAVAAADRAILLDNSFRRPRLLIAAETGRPPRIAERLPQWLAALLPSLRLPGAR